MRVVTLEDSSCPIAAVQVWYGVGSKDEQSDRQGYATCFEHMMFKGTDRAAPRITSTWSSRPAAHPMPIRITMRPLYIQTLTCQQH